MLQVDSTLWTWWHVWGHWTPWILERSCPLRLFDSHDTTTTLLVRLQTSRVKGSTSCNRLSRSGSLGRICIYCARQVHHVRRWSSSTSSEVRSSHGENLESICQFAGAQHREEKSAGHSAFQERARDHALNFRPDEGGAPRCDVCWNLLRWLSFWACVSSHTHSRHREVERLHYRLKLRLGLCGC